MVLDACTEQIYNVDTSVCNKPYRQTERKRFSLTFRLLCRLDKLEVYAQIFAGLVAVVGHGINNKYLIPEELIQSQDKDNSVIHLKQFALPLDEVTITNIHITTKETLLIWIKQQLELVMADIDCADDWVVDIIVEAIGKPGIAATRIGDVCEYCILKRGPQE